MLRFYIAAADTAKATGVCFPPGVKAKGEYETLTEEEFRAMSPGQIADALMDALGIVREAPAQPIDQEPPHIFDDPEAWRSQPDMGNGVDF